MFENLKVFRNANNGILLTQDIISGHGEMVILLTSEMVDGLCKELKKLKHDIEVNPDEGEK